MAYTTHRFRLPAPLDPKANDTGNGSATPASDGISDTSAHRKPGLAACNRCRRLKKRCSKQPPRCELCIHAGKRCSLSNADAPSTPRRGNSQPGREWPVRSTDGYGYPSPPDLSAMVSGPEVSQSTGTSTADESSSHHFQPGAVIAHETGQYLPVNAGTLFVDDSQGGPGQRSQPHIWREIISHGTPSSDTGSMLAQPSFVEAGNDTGHMAQLHAYFRHVGRVYPFIDKSKLLRTAQALSGQDLRDSNDPEARILYLVRAIGRTTLERKSGDAPKETAGTEIPYADILQHCMMHENEQTVRILALLAIHSLFDPKGMPTISIVRILTQQAMTLGLTKTSTQEDALSPQDVELRHRLFWSIFVLDRMTAFSLGQPAGLVTSDTDVPFPTLTVSEFASPERANYAYMLQVSRHVIQLRTLESQILAQVHLRSRSDVSALAALDRAAIISRLRLEIANWYGNGCLISLPEEDNIPIHNSITWLNARYYHLLLILYYPCHFNSGASYVSKIEYFDFLRKHVQYNKVLLADGQLPLNAITLCRLMPVCLVLLYCYDLSTAEDILDSIHLLEAFPVAWSKAHHAARTMREYKSLISNSAGASTSSLPFSQQPADLRLSDHQTRLQCLKRDLVAVCRDLLGKSTCYQYVDWDIGPKSIEFSSHGVQSKDAIHSRSTATRPAMLQPSYVDLGFLY
ncbi:hypothetical protein ABEF95_006980 [Exophiala dermatitidis]